MIPKISDFENPDKWLKKSIRSRQRAVRQAAYMPKIRKVTCPCGHKFTTTHGAAKYCCRRHADRYRVREWRARAKREGR